MAIHFLGQFVKTFDEKMMMKQRNARSRTKPEIIIRHSWFINACGKKELPVPEILILANRKGFLWLANVLRKLADKKPGPFLLAHFDPEDHQHVGPRQSPGVFNQAQSDDVELRLGILTDFNRRAVFRKYGRDKTRRLKGSALAQFRSLLNRIKAGMKAENRRRTRKSRSPTVRSAERDSRT